MVAGPMAEIVFEMSNDTERRNQSHQGTEAMNSYCPECETELDLTTGICPACRSDPMAARAVVTTRTEEPEMSLTERYRGTQYDVTLEQAMDDHANVSRGRSFVIVALVAGVVLYGGVMSAMGIF
jgi:hypothetical protein